MNPPTAAVALFALIGAAATLGGCVLADAPKLTVIDAAIVEQSSSDALVMVTVEAENPNDEPLPLRLARYELTVDGGGTSFSERSAEAALPAKGKSALKLFSVVPSGGGVTGQGYRTSGKVDYVSPGRFAEALYDLGILRSSASFAGAGELSVGRPVPGSNTGPQSAPVGETKPSQSSPK